MTNTTIHPVDAAQIKLLNILDRAWFCGGDDLSIDVLCRIPGATRAMVDAAIDGFHTIRTGRVTFRITGRKTARKA